MIVEPVTSAPPRCARPRHRALATSRAVRFTTEQQNLVGILTIRDIRFVEPSELVPSSRFMTPQPLVTGSVGISLQDAKRILQKHRTANSCGEMETAS